MSELGDTIKALKSLNDSLTLMEERHKNQVAKNERFEAEISALREAVAVLTTRVSVLEEARKTTDEHVRRVITETVAGWQVERAQRENEQMREELERLRRQLPPKDSG